MNAETHKDTWPVDYGLARGYSAVGEYGKALKHLKIALSRVPDPGNKAAIEANITKLEKGHKKRSIRYMDGPLKLMMLYNYFFTNFVVVTPSL